MELLTIAGTPVLGWAVSQLLTKVVKTLRKLKDKDKNVRALCDILEYLEPWVEQLSSVPDVHEHAGKWWTDLRDLLMEAEALAQSSGRRVHEDSLQDEALAQSSGRRVHEDSLQDEALGQSSVPTPMMDDRSTQAEALVQSPGREIHRDSKRRKLQFWTTSGKALDLCKRIRHLLDVGTMFYFAYRSNLDKSLVESTDKILEKLEKLEKTHERVEQLLPFRDSGIPEEKRRFGGDDVERKVRENLLKGDDKWVGLWGMGGIGKTFMASSISRDPAIEEHFGGNVYWVTVSKDQADPARVCNELLKTLYVGPRSLKDAKSFLKEKFRGKRVLLILDDVWEGDPGEEKILQHLDVVSSDTKSVIFVTTREKNIFPKEWKPELFRIPILSVEDSWALFSWHAFGRHGRTVPDDLESVAWEVAKECEGLPLALEVIGSTMAGKEITADEEECFDIKPLDIWERALSNLKDASKEENDYKRLFQRLQISVDNLQSFRLKDCFFYFAAFPEDYWVEEETLINFWVAEGLVEKDENRSFSGEKNARLDLARLVAKSMIQVNEEWSYMPRNEHGIKRRSYRVHDVIRDLARHNVKTDMETGKLVPVFERDCLYAPGLNNSTLPKEWTKPCTELKARRLSLMANDLDEFPGNLKKTFRAPNLQVLMLGESESLRALSTIFMQSLSNLTVLDLHKTELQELPDALLHGLPSLVLLDLTDCSKLETVSDEVDKLPSLEFLFLGGCDKLRNLPRVSQLTNLRCLKIEVPFHKQEAEVEFGGFGDEQETEVEFGGFEDEQEAEVEFGGFKDEQNAEDEDEELEDKQEAADEDEEFKDEPEADDEDEKFEDAWEQGKADKDSQTQQEVILDDEGTARERFAEEVPHPVPFHLPESVRKLYLCGFGRHSRYCFDISSLSNLEELEVFGDVPFPACGDHLHHLRILDMAIQDDSPIPRLGKLAELEHLRVHFRRRNLQSVESYFGIDVFPSLKAFTFEIETQVEGIIIFRQSAMPRVEYLHVGLYNDNQLPESIRQLRTLKSLTITFMTCRIFSFERLRLLFSQQQYLPELKYVSIHCHSLSGTMITREMLPLELLEREREGRLTLDVARE